MTESYAAKKTVFCSSFMNLEEPANLRVASFLEAGFLEDVGNMVDDDESIVQLQYRVSRVCTSQSTRKTNFYFSLPVGRWYIKVQEKSRGSTLRSSFHLP